MTSTTSAALFLGGLVLSLGASVVLVSRLERLGQRLLLSEALLGLLAALAADTPEITAAVTALAHGEHQIGAGVVIGSNVFNLVALLGLGATVAGTIALHRRVVVLSGVLGIYVAGICLAAVVGAIPPTAALIAAGVPLTAYATLLASPRRIVRFFRLPRVLAVSLVRPVVEEELELYPVIHPRRGHAADAVVAIVALGTVVGASAVMERSAVLLGTTFRIPQIVLGGVVLAAVTSLPNAVAAVYLAVREKGTAVLSIALNSNAINVTIGLLLPGALVGIGKPAGGTVLVAGWYLGLTTIALAIALLRKGLSRRSGLLIVASYLAFVPLVLLAADGSSPGGP